MRALARPVLSACAFAALIALGGCSGGLRLSPYRIDIRQGNYVTQEMVSRLKPGMTRDQVRFVLGTPLVSDLFHADRWDYFYRFQPGWGEPQSRRLSVFFEDGTLRRVEGDVVAEDGSAPPVAAQPTQSRVIEIGPGTGEAAGPAPAAR
ncbi:MAG: hypothetical protein Fur0039_21580 [Rhodocyclaceae bacterium]